MSIEKFSLEKVLSVHRWTNTLFSFHHDQTCTFQVYGRTVCAHWLESGDELVVRAYSVVSSPLMKRWNFFDCGSEGKFTSNLQHLKVGDELFREISYGYLTLARYQLPLPQDLWLLVQVQVWHHFYPCCKTLRPGININILTWFIASVLKTNWLCRPYSGNCRDLWRRSYRFKFIPIITRDPEAALHHRLPILIEMENLNGQQDSSLI